MPNSRVRRSPRPRRLTGALLATALLVGAPAATAQAEGWIDGPAFDVPLMSEGLDLAGAPDGSSTAAWIAEDDAAAVKVSVQRAAPDGTLGTVRVLDDADPGPDPVWPVVAAGASGASAVAWQDEVGGDDQLRLALLAAGGTVGAPLLVAPDQLPLETGVAVAVDGDGDATVVWRAWDDGLAAEAIHARRVAADGTLGPVVVLGLGGLEADPRIAVTPNGVAWVTWTDGTGSGAAQRIARLDAAGQLDGAVAEAPADAASFPTLGAGAAGGALAWSEAVPGGSDMRVAGVRLPLSGEVLGAPFHGAPAPVSMPAVATPAIAPDGTVTIAWTEATSSTPPISATAIVSRIAPGAATGPAQPLPTAEPGVAAVAPLLAAMPDGGVLATWLQQQRPSVALTVPLFARRIASNGTFGPVTATGASAFGLGGPFDIDRYVLPFAHADGGALLGVLQQFIAFSLSTRVLDATGPKLTASTPATATAGAPAPFSASASDRTGASVWWDFGDDSGSRRAAVDHVYTRAGTYTVTLTATDGVGNETTITRRVTVAAAAGPSRTPRAGRAAAALALTRTVRKGAKVTVAGTISPHATGRVTIAYRKKVGRTTVFTRKSATIARGRWRATLKLTGPLARARRGKATITAFYAGDAATRRANVTRTIRLAKASPKRR
ncbi:PKD domain-containing protein [Conexibacter woesei]|uniref:PKD domain containing protein n=1 Tax=Conexibacter woesei (strain DSM 14684 / CCUG 47730 / CIP 108061 / JCM 11494 / NBRC 100937 / ID131577) TaxID=469383 RepID=D3F9S3_CONWI|nr:PKD domain-containing protein [Conexibacter woesei]ADB51135.1 PKD domain containing protein [Conexibacter woesei DSM 14684]